MAEKIRRGIFIGRFQPFHIGHLAVVEEMNKNSNLDEIIIAIGSYQYDYSHKKPDQDIAENPFTGEERKEMINSVLKNRISKQSRIIPLPDIHNFPKWVSYVKESVPEFEIVYSGNTIVRELFLKDGYKVESVSGYEVSATTIRDMISKNEGKWKSLVPSEVADFIESIGGEERIRELYAKKERMRSPSPAADIIIKYTGKNPYDNIRNSNESNSAEIVLVERKYQPFGWALPGGFIEYGETAEDAAKREAFEETGLEIEIERLLGIYSDPKRDCRKHVLSVCYVAHSSGEPRAGDDAKGIAVVNEKELEDFIRERGLAFDHEKILMDYLESEKRE